MNVTAGTARWSARAGLPAASAAATRAWYLPACVNIAMPVTSPAAQTPSPARMCSSTSIPRFEISTPSASKPKPSTAARRPVATISRSPESGRAALQVHVDPGLDPLDLAAQVDVDALAGEHVAEERAGVGMVAREQAVGDVGQRHLRAHAAEELGQLAADRPGAEDDEALRDLADARRLAVRPVVDAVQALDRRDRRHRAGRDHEPLVAELAAGGLDEARLADDRLAAHELDVAVGEPLLLRRVVPVARHLVAVPEDARGVELSR